MMVLTLNIQLQNGLRRLSKSIISFTDVISRMMSGDRSVSHAEPPDEILSRGQFSLPAMPLDLGGRGALGDSAGQGDGVAGLGNDLAVGGDGFNFGFN